MERTAEQKAGRRAGVRDLTYIGIMVAFMAVCSWISIPTAVPFTMQTFAVFLAVGVFGGRRGTMAVLVYILLGAVGMPVFAGFSGGIGVLVGLTGGYIAGFVLTALIMWGMERAFGRKTAVFWCSAVLGLMACYAFGTFWYLFMYARTAEPVGIMTVLGWCVIPFVIPDLLKITLAAAMSKRLGKAVRSMGA